MGSRLNKPELRVLVPQLHAWHYLLSALHTNLGYRAHKCQRFRGYDRPAAGFHNSKFLSLLVSTHAPFTDFHDYNFDIAASKLKFIANAECNFSTCIPPCPEFEIIVRDPRTSANDRPWVGATMRGRTADVLFALLSPIAQTRKAVVSGWHGRSFS